MTRYGVKVINWPRLSHSMTAKCAGPKVINKLKAHSLLIANGTIISRIKELDGVYLLIILQFYAVF